MSAAAAAESIRSTSPPQEPGASTAHPAGPGSARQNPAADGTENPLLAAFARLSPQQREQLRAQLAGAPPAALPAALPPAPSSTEGGAPAGPAELPGPHAAEADTLADNRPTLPAASPDARGSATAAPPAAARATAFRASSASASAPAAAASRNAQRRVARDSPRRATTEPSAPVAPPAHDRPRAAVAEEPATAPPPGAWREPLAESIGLIEQELAESPGDETEQTRRAAISRLLHVLANHSERAVAEIDALPEDEREFWKHQAHALLLALDADGKNAASQRHALALRALRAAEGHLANLSALDVRNLALCESVESYGQFTEFRSQTFRPGTQVLLYVEIDNFTVEPVGEKFETELQGLYEIVDAQGSRVANVRLPLDKQVGNNRRRDYFIAYDIYLPRDIPPGSYTLHLTMEDVKGHKSSQASVDFRIR